VSYSALRNSRLATCNKNCLNLLQNRAMSIQEKIAAQIHALPEGELLLPSDFSDLGSSEAVRLALFRLEKAGIIVRVAQGIYVRPKISKWIGPISPSAEEVAEAIAKRDRIRTVPTGSYALNAVGLSTQVPMNIVFLTDGSPREIKVGKRTIKFKKTTPKNLLAKGKISRLVIQALKEIGNGNVTEDEGKKIFELLKKEDEKDLKHDIALAPVWIQKMIKKGLTCGQI
jgi:ribosomal protein S19E (S16A)